MNVFYLDRDPLLCAKMHCDKHVVKMILEYAQLLSTAHRILDDYDGDSCYKKTHQNHPCAIWVRESKQHYDFVFMLLRCTCAEYTRRYKRQHKTEMYLPFLSQLPLNITDQGWSEPPQCMPEDSKCSDTVQAYRRYYAIHKSYMAVWNRSEEPEWWADAIASAYPREAALAPS